MELREDIRFSEHEAMKERKQKLRSLPSEAQAARTTYSQVCQSWLGWALLFQLLLTVSVIALWFPFKSSCTCDSRNYNFVQGSRKCPSRKDLSKASHEDLKHLPLRLYGISPKDFRSTAISQAHSLKHQVPL